MILINGHECGSVPATDRGLAYGDGVFRTFTMRGGVALHWPRQYRKLVHDCDALALAAPARGALEGDLARLAQWKMDAVLKIIVTRGPGERGYRYRAGTAPSRIVMGAAIPQYPESYAESGVRVHRCRLRLSHQPVLAGIKHLNRLENVLARAEWNDDELSEGLLEDMEGRLIGGTMTNVSLVTGGRLATPDLTRCGVAGVTRERVIEAAAAHGIACRVGDLTCADLDAADEVFVVNSVIGVWPVNACEHRAWPAGPVTGAVRQWLEHE